MGFRPSAVGRRRRPAAADDVVDASLAPTVGATFPPTIHRPSPPGIRRKTSDFVAGKAVFVGYSARRQPDQQDDYPYVYSVDGFNLSGVEMAATALANLIQGSHLKTPAVRASIVGLWGLVIAAAFRFCRVRRGVMLGFALMAAYAYAALLAFRVGNIWLPIVVPALQFLLAGALALRVKQLWDRVELGSAAGEEAALALTGRGKREKVDHRVVLFADEAASKKRVRRGLTAARFRRRRRALRRARVGGLQA